MRALLLTAPVTAAALPSVASAQALTYVAGIFNIFVGLMLVAAFLLYFGALIGWAIRLGAWPSYRDDMIHIMEWAVAVMFTLVLILAVVHFVQAYRAAAAFVFGIAVFLIIVWLIMTAATGTPEKDDDH